MRVTFKDMDDREILVTNDMWDNDNFVTVCVGSESIDVSLDDFLHALHMFKEIRTGNAEREALYELKHRV